ncbi:unnamed protein product [Phytophthora fragariaefolia]|uniref:Unnamed protein product n=1 Tax=Phytophthora fragariaefolia TaxID=1490495 RepID=A0A9W6XVL2_9STRA|nr:unnamed protein product [Phytophthora fragariaefolia]
MHQSFGGWSQSPTVIMECIPLLLFSSIITFAVREFSEDIIPDKRNFFFASEDLKNVALVSKSWHASVREVVSRYQLSTLTLQFYTASRAELLEMRAKVLNRGRQVVDLRVSVGDAGSFGKYFMRRRRLPETLETLELGWDALMAHLPGLRRLDLSEMPLASPHTVKVVEAASKFCRQLEALILPGKEHEMQHGADADSLLDAVYEGLNFWKSAGHRQGLRQLKVPTINGMARYQSCKKFFDKVVELCPQVEYLDGYKQSLCEMDNLTCHSAWLLTLEDWKKFTAACTNIREFNWVVAPFADPYFAVFGEHVKSKLTKLVFSVNTFWDWRQYFFVLDKESGLQSATNIDIADREGYGRLARNASTALLGCPGLQELEIALYHPPSEDELEHLHITTRGRIFFPDEVLEKNIFGDHFWETLAANCPLINRISLWEVLAGIQVQHIHSFTDRGLVALTKLKYLDFMELRPVNCTGDGLFDFLNGFSGAVAGQRTFEISVGGITVPPEYERTDMNFYHAVTRLLVRIDDTPANDLQVSKQRIVLRLVNAVDRSVEKDWAVNYLDQLQKLVARVKGKHLALRLRVRALGYSGKSFKSITELGLYAAHANPSNWFGWDKEESNRDIVFVNCGDRCRSPDGP